MAIDGLEALLTYCGICICSRLTRRCPAAGCISTWGPARIRETSVVGTFAWREFFHMFENLITLIFLPYILITI